MSLNVISISWSKVCFKCKIEKDKSEFYKHQGMSDGRIGKCKVCVRKDVTKNRSENIDRFRAYDRARGNRQKPGYAKTYRKRYPNKYKATTLVNNAIRGNNLFKEPCVVCGSTEVHAHHDDYAKPLNVKWLCAVHHKQWHVENGPGLNSN